MCSIQLFAQPRLEHRRLKVTTCVKYASSHCLRWLVDCSPTIFNASVNQGAVKSLWVAILNTICNREENNYCKNMSENTHTTHKPPRPSNASGLEGAKRTSSVVSPSKSFMMSALAPTLLDLIVLYWPRDCTLAVVTVPVDLVQSRGQYNTSILLYSSRASSPAGAIAAGKRERTTDNMAVITNTKQTFPLVCLQLQQCPRRCAAAARSCAAAQYFRIHHCHCHCH